MRRPQSDAPIALLTDFGYRDHYAGAMKGVLASIAPDAALLDITHGVPPQSIAAGAIALRESWRFFPQRTVFLVVVDPGVGTSRLPIAVETRTGARFVGPDNARRPPRVDSSSARQTKLHLPRTRYLRPRGRIPVARNPTRDARFDACSYQTSPSSKAG